MNKIVIVGCGNVGMSFAYALFNQKTNVDELVLIDLDKDRVMGEVMDLSHCLPFAPDKINVKCGDYSDCSNATIVCIAAGAKQEIGETRMDLINKNSGIFKSIVTSVMNSGFNGIFLVATNPLDVMTYLTWKYSGLPSRKVIGSGTSLDTARLRFMISDKLHINSKNVHGYVIGEHGDSEFIPWSNINIGLQNISYFMNKEDMAIIEDNVRNAAYDIINKKGSTCYGIGMCLARITNAILNNENSVITVSTFEPVNKIFIGLPTILNSDGAKDKIYVNLNEEETNKLQISIDKIKDAINSIEI